VIERDLRNKRKVNNGEIYATFVNTAEQGSTHTISVIGIIRCLILST